ncbi:MAG: glycosyltransferase family 2 protein [Ruminococcaceae bacterium]|nr:glycosyltransferase family 2 protein [Oscillospiraceae bacterium]
MKISVIVPSYNTSEEHLSVLYQSLLCQTHQEFEVIVVDDCSQFDSYEMLQDPRFRVERMPQNGGPAKCRNRGAELSESEFLFFTDSDCELAPETLSQVAKGLEKEKVIMGNTITKTKTFFGTCVAYLGFPGGGILGFDKVWRVDEHGYTDSISSCNLAIRKGFFDEMERFNTNFPVPGGEDTYFSKKIVAKSEKIWYNREQVVYHVERGDLKGFLRWQITRGRGNYHIKKNLGSVGSFYKLRLWSFWNSLKASTWRFPVVGMLILLSVIYQSKGYKMEVKNQECE